MQNHPCAVMKQLLTLASEEAGPAAQGPDRDAQREAWNKTVTSALAHTKVQSKLDMLGYSAVSCSDLLKIASRACAQLQAGELPRY